MRKFYSFLLALCLGCSLPAYSTTTLTADAVVSIFSDHEVYKFYDFNAWTCNDQPLGDWAYSSTAASFKVNKMNVYQLTSDGLTNFYIQDTGKMYHREDRAMGIFNSASGARSLTITDMHAGQMVVIDGGASQNYPWTSSYVFNTDAVTDLSDSVHATQDTPDGFFYLRMEEDGQLEFYINRACYINAIAITQSASAVEFVSEPTAEIMAVDGTSREVKVKPGESSKGNAVSTWYTIDGTAPLFLEDTDVILSADTLWNADSTAYELTNITYVQHAVKDGEYWGNFMYDNSPIRIDSNDDEDGDGIVELKLASVSEATGIASSIVTIEVSVGEIQLNAPTLTLVSMDGTKRGYQLGWDNNLITDVAHTFYVYFDDAEDDSYTEGDIIWAAEHIEVTVQADGYTPGSTSLNELAQQGVSYERKGDATAGHNWDFVNIPADTLERIKGTVIDYYYVVDPETGDTTRYEGVEVPAEAVEHYAFWGWDFQSDRNRAWPRVYVDTLHVTAADGVTDSTYTVATYAADQTHLTDGLEIGCAPYLNSSSAWAASYAIYTNGSGLYNMSKLTITIPTVVYGEYVLISSSNGYAFEMCENTEGGYSYELGRGAYLYYIDVFTSDNLPDGISLPTADRSLTTPDGAIYDLSGRRVSQPTQGGIYIQNGRKFVVR